MKKIKVLILFMALSAITFYSCNDNESIENQAETQKSFALRMVLNEIKKENNISGRSTSTESDGLCFEFVFPLNLSFNNGTVVSVTSMDGIIDILANENENLYINGIAFPFQVTTTVSNATTTVTINNESDFEDLIQSCGMETYDNYVSSGMCYEYAYPLSYINQNGATIVVQSESELFESIFTDGNDIFELVFPVSVIYEGQTVQINSLYELFEMDNNCASNSCICTEEYAPVCVMTTDGSIIQFPNACHAQCAGYILETDLVDCGIIDEVVIDGMGDCFTIQYPVQVQSGGAIVTVNSDEELFNVFNSAPATGAEIVYPFVVNFVSNGQSFTAISEEALMNQVSVVCN